MKYYVGIDLGGTNTKIGLVDEKGILFYNYCENWFNGRFSETIQRLSKILITQIEGSNVNFDNVVSVGVGVPGPVLNSRVVKFWANFPWKMEWIWHWNLRKFRKTSKGWQWCKCNYTWRNVERCCTGI